MLIKKGNQTIVVQNSRNNLLTIIVTNLMTILLTGWVYVKIKVFFVLFVVTMNLENLIHLNSKIALILVNKEIMKKNKKKIMERVFGYGVQLKKLKKNDIIYLFFKIFYIKYNWSNINNLENFIN